MKEEHIKKALENVSQAVADSFRQPMEIAKQRRDAISAKISHTREITSYVQSSLQDILKMCKSLAQEETSVQIVKEISTLDQKIKTYSQQMHDEVQRLTGAIEVFEFSIARVSQIGSSFENEILKAREIQDLQSQGKLEERRKPGSRPVKLKDIRDYAEKDESPEMKEGDDGNS